jgi:multidrug resistance efflux pump
MRFVGNSLLWVMFALTIGETAANGSRDQAFAAQGRIEGVSESVDLGFTIGGRVYRVTVEEGQRVSRGQVLAELECLEEHPAAKAAAANLDSVKQAYLRAKRGARTEQRAVAEARKVSSQAELKEAEAEFARIRDLVNLGNLASKRELDQAQRRLDVIRAGLDIAIREAELVNSALLPEEDARWKADIGAATQAHQMALARERQCVIYSPIDGVLLKRHALPGEIVSVVPPRVVLTVADISRVRARVEIDERDALKVQVGQKAAVLVPDDSNRRFPGKVLWIGPSMGRKTVRGTDPAEKSDRDIREVLVELAASAAELPIGLRVTTTFAP